jgi:hypothetical protein
MGMGNTLAGVNPNADSAITGSSQCKVSSVTLMRRKLPPYLTSHILRFGAYATDELHIPPDVFDPALDEVDVGGEQPAAA